MKQPANQVMYNGLGLKTPRGSGTNGYVQRNLSFAKPKNPNNTFKYDQAPPKAPRKVSADIILHNNKRKVEVDCLLYEEELLTSKKYTEAEVKEKVLEFRQRELSKLEESMKRNRDEVLKEEKESEMLRIREAFGIKENAVEGGAFKFESEKDRQERLALLAEEDRIEKRRKLRDR